MLWQGYVNNRRIRWRNKAMKEVKLLTAKNKANVEINSHIQMPKLLLKRFHNKNNKFFYYDVKGNFIGTNGTAESTNTKLGYYSIEIENYFRDNIETPLGNFLALIEQNGFKTQTLGLPSNFSDIAKNFMRALVARSPSFLEQMKSEESVLINLPETKQHDLVAKIGINIANEHEIFSDYIVTFMINDTNIPFVLSVDGIYNYTLNGHSVINLPISPKAAISLIHESYVERVLYQDGAVAMFVINEIDKIKLMNYCSFSSQIKQKFGRIICPERAELERLKAEFNR